MAAIHVEKTSSFSWALEPFNLIDTVGPTERPFSNKIGVFYAHFMCVIHNMINRGFNAAYNQAKAIQSGTKSADDFLVFNQFLYEFISNHHEVEDNVFFPDLEAANKSPGLMSENTEQHKLFHDGLEEFGKYVNETSKDHYDSNKLLRIMDSFREPMVQHLRDELTTFLDLRDENNDALMDVFRKSHKTAIAHMDKFRVAPLMFMCHDEAFKIDGESYRFPVPFFVPYLNKFYYTRRHGGAWEFAPCDLWQHPKSRIPFSAGKEN